MDKYIINLFKDEPSFGDAAVMSFTCGSDYVLKNILMLHEPYVGWWAEIAHEAKPNQLVAYGVLCDDIIVEWAVEFNLKRFLPSDSGFDYDWNLTWDYEQHTITADSFFHTMDAVGGYGPVVPVQAIFQMDDKDEYPIGYIVPDLVDEIDASILIQVGRDSCLDVDETCESRGYDDAEYCTFGIGVVDDIAERLSELIKEESDLPYKEDI